MMRIYMSVLNTTTTNYQETKTNIHMERIVMTMNAMKQSSIASSLRGQNFQQIILNASNAGCGVNGVGLLRIPFSFCNEKHKNFMN